MRITNSHYGYIVKQTVSGMEIVESVTVPKFTDLEPGPRDLSLLKDRKEVKAVGRFWFSKPFKDGHYMVVDWLY